MMFQRDFVPRVKFNSGSGNPHRRKLWIFDEAQFDVAEDATGHGALEGNVWDREHGVVDGRNIRGEDHGSSDDGKPDSGTV